MVIPYPEHQSEFEVQAWLYSTLRGIGLDVRGEVKTLFKPKTRHEKAQFCRFDLVEYSEGKATRIYEVKAARVKHKAGFDATRQGQRYPQFGIPVTVVYGMAEAVDVVAQASERCQVAERV